MRIPSSLGWDEAGGTQCKLSLEAGEKAGCGTQTPCTETTILQVLRSQSVHLPWAQVTLEGLERGSCIYKQLGKFVLDPSQTLVQGDWDSFPFLAGGCWILPQESGALLTLSTLPAQDPALALAELGTLLE